MLLVLLMEWMVSLIDLLLHADVADKGKNTSDCKEKHDNGEDGEAVGVGRDHVILTGVVVIAAPELFDTCNYATLHFYLKNNLLIIDIMFL